MHRKIDLGLAPQPSTSIDFILWVHKEFCGHLPENLLVVSDPKTGKEVKLIPGELRQGPRPRTCELRAYKTYGAFDFGRPRDTPIWKLESSFRCRSRGTRRYKPPVRMIKLTERREITPYRWVHPDEER
ncbi:hypothetical protein CQ12_37855 [Bradyrhizobium jicamae]|uniref:Uncharacterized protein n=1 Tax=Bradyrhizobium jicamae TaxID=280332 RepID=A0A0R3L7R4_9BRAD|nr:hypothetical protein CQ12_37855 [Bradyrhizobium jicamae]